MKTTAKIKKGKGRLSVFVLVCFSALLFSCEKNEMPVVKQNANQVDNNSDINRTKSQAQTIILIDHVCAQTAMPAYTVEVKSDGAVFYTGRKNVSTLGEKRFRISSTTLSEIRNLIIESNFAEIYSLPYIKDYALNSMSYRQNPDMRIITKIDYDGRPANLVLIRQSVEKALEISKFVYGSGILESSKIVSEN